LPQDQQKVALNDWLNKREFDNAEKVQGVTAIYDELKIKELTTEKMNHYFDLAFEQNQKRLM